MTENPWFVAATHPWAEQDAYEKLTERGFFAYSPVREVCRIVRGVRRCRPAPLFPGYVFVEAHDRWREVATTRGILGFLPIGREEPAPLSFAIFAELRARVDAGEFLTPAGDEWLKSLVFGAELRVTAGAYADRIGKFLGHDRGRIYLLLQLFNRELPVPIPTHTVELLK